MTLTGVRVVEFSSSVAAAACGRLLASLGADVTVVEPPGGHALRRAAPLLPDGTSASFRYQMLHKRVIAGPLDDAMLAGATIVVSDHDGDPAAARALDDRLRAVNEGAVHVVTSGFGLDGPYASYRHTPLVDWAAGGHMSVTGEPGREPLAGGGPWASVLHGATAAFGALAAWGAGGGRLVDSSAMEALAGAHQWGWTMWTYGGCEKQRWGNRHGESHHPLCLLEAGDGRWVCLGVATAAQWEGLCLAADIPELLADEGLMLTGVRFDRADEVDAALRPWLMSHTADEVVAACQEHRVPAGKVQDFAEVLDDAQLATRDWWEVPDGLASAKAPGPAFRVQPSRPAPAATPAPPVDLRGVRVVEFGVAWAGPLAAHLLGDLGADVVKVEHPTARGYGVFAGGEVDLPKSPPGVLPPPQVRPSWFPDAEPGERWWNRQGVYNEMNRSKRSLCLDVKAGEGRDILRRLVEASDVVVNNYSPRGVRSLGIDRETLRSWNPRIVTVDMSGYGATGPLADHYSWGPILESHAGTAAAAGYPDGGPMKVGVAFPDPVGGVHGALAIAAALVERDRTGSAVHVDLSQLEVLLTLAGDQVLATSVTGQPPRRRGNAWGGGAWEGVVACQGEDAWVAISAGTGAERDALAAVVGPGDLDAAVAAWAACRTKWAAQDALQAAGVPAAAVHTNADLCRSAHLAARGFDAVWDQPDVGVRSHPGFPLHISGLDARARPCPPLGGDNRDILVGLLGYSDADVGGGGGGGGRKHPPPPPPPQGAIADHPPS